MTDPISDMLARIRNAALVKKPAVVVPYSQLKARVADILVNEGYVSSVREDEQPYRVLVLQLKYEGGQSVIRSLKRVSRPGRRSYVKSTELPRVLSDLGIAIVSTSKGLMTNREAKEKHLGGEVLCEIY
jgi:small subunit ribosomal protein S8